MGDYPKLSALRYGDITLSGLLYIWAGGFVSLRVWFRRCGPSANQQRE
jgi:hypothetical protein